MRAPSDYQMGAFSRRSSCRRRRLRSSRACVLPRPIRFMLVVSEMVGASSGLGYLIVNAQYLLSVHLLYVGVIVLALLGIASNWALVALERRLGAWRPDLHP